MLDNVQLSIVQSQKLQTEHNVKIKIEQVLISKAQLIIFQLFVISVGKFQALRCLFLIDLLIQQLICGKYSGILIVP